MLSRNVSGPIQQPFEANSLSVILEANGTEGVPKRSRSPARWRGSLQQSRTHIEEVPNVHRSEEWVWHCGSGFIIVWLEARVGVASPPYGGGIGIS